MPDPEQTPGPRRQDPVRRLARPMGVVSGYSLPLAGTGMLLMFAAAAATAGLQAALGMSGTLIAIIAMVVSGDPAADTSIATPLLAFPWNVIGPGLPPSAALSVARGVLTLAATAWGRHPPASRALQRAATAAGTAAAASLAS